MHKKLKSPQQLLGAIQAKAVNDDLVLVAIDGHAGAGKSTLASWLATHLQHAQVITLDDFYRALSPQQQQQLQADKALQAYFDVTSFATQILQPLANQMPVSWQPIDWLTAQPLALKTVRPQGVVLIEGVFACHQALLDYMDISVMVMAGSQQRQQRVLGRSQPDTHWYQHWAETETWYHQTNGTQALATYLYSGEQAVAMLS